jgi:hypothetical protein
MPRADDQGAERPSEKKRADEAPKDSRRKQVPAPESIVSETTLQSPKGRTYRIIRTNQMDPYDEPLAKSEDKSVEQTHEQPARPKKKRRRKP